jgi:hypothetical protein
VAPAFEIAPIGFDGIPLKIVGTPPSVTGWSNVNVNIPAVPVIARQAAGGGPDA